MWRFNWHLFLIYVSCHAFLIAVLPSFCGPLGLNLISIRGIAKSLGVAIVGTFLVLVLVLVMGAYVAFGLVYSGQAFATPVLATLIYASLAPRLSLITHPHVVR